MKKSIPLLAFVAIAVVISGCATQNPYVALATRTPTTEDNQATYFFAAFQDANLKSEKAVYPDAAIIVRAAVESAFVRYGKHVVQEKGDIEIAGIVTAYYQGSFTRGYTTVGIDLKAIDQKTGGILWTASGIKSTQYWYQYDPARWTQEVADELVKALVAASKKR